MPILSLFAAPNALVLLHNAYADSETFALEQWQESGAADVLGVKAVGRGMMVAINPQG
jgi:hypothetical protein